MPATNGISKSRSMLKAGSSLPGSHTAAPAGGNAAVSLNVGRGQRKVYLVNIAGAMTNGQFLPAWLAGKEAGGWAHFGGLWGIGPGVEDIACSFCLLPGFPSLRSAGGPQMPP